MESHVAPKVTIRIFLLCVPKTSNWLLQQLAAAVDCAETSMEGGPHIVSLVPKAIYGGGGSK